MPATPPPIPQTGDLSHEQIEAKLRAAHRRQRQYVHTRGLARLAIVFVIAVLLSFLIDWGLQLGSIGRLILLLANLLALGYTGWKYWLSRIERYDETRLALQVERNHPELRSILISYVQFRAQSAEDADRFGVSHRLVDAVRRQAAQVTRRIDFRDIVDFQTISRIITAAVLLTVMLMMMTAIWPSHFGSLAQRLINPLAAVAYPTRTQIQTITADLVVRQGDPVTITTTAAGRVPQQGEIRIRSDADAPWETATLENDGSNVFDYHLPQVYTSFDYFVRIGDDRTAVYRVRVVDAPRIAESTIAMDYPAQVPRDDEVVAGLNHQVPEGTRLTWTITFDRPLRSIQMIEVDHRVVPSAERSGPILKPIENIRLNTERTVATAEYRADRSFHYRFAYTDSEHGFTYDDPVEYVIQTTPDGAPTVEVVEPVEPELIATLNKTMPIAFQAADDYGVSRATLVYRVNDEQPQRTTIGQYDRRHVPDRMDWRLREQLPRLAVGDVVTWWIEVADNQADEPNVGVSGERRVRIVSVAEYQQYIFEQIEALTEQLEQVREQEDEAARSVRELKSQTQPGREE